VKVQAKEATLRFYKERLLRVLVHIQQRLDEPLDLAELARLACLSPHHFHHVFTGMIGESLGSHVRRLRLERAAWRLKLTEMPVVQIAFEAGYGTHEAFSRAFGKGFGVPPIQYRRRNGVSARLHNAAAAHYQPRKRLRDFRVAKVEDPAMNVTVKNLKPMRVAFMRHIGPYDQVGKTWDQFLMLLGKDGLLGGNAQFIGISPDDPAVTPPEKIRCDACMTMDQAFRPRGEIGAQVIRGGDYAVLTHFGPYDTIGQSYAKLLGQWLPRSGRRLRAAPCLEFYFNSPENTEPEDLVTDLYAPLEMK
jgi:AraC family transcriptional regulator